MFWAAMMIGLAWMAVRTAVVRALPAGTPLIAAIASTEADPILDIAMVEFVERRGALPPATLEAVRKAALRAPLDARPYLLLGHQALLDREDARATVLLEAGRRLDPRQRWIHVLLLDRYLRTKRYAEAAAQFAVLARLTGAAQARVAQALAQMSIAPETHDAVRRTLRSDLSLEIAVMGALAKSDTDPEVILSLASPAALVAASEKNGWGPALVNRLVGRGEYEAARALWARIHRISPAALAPAVYDAAFKGLPGSPPFNWMLTGSGLGAAELRRETLAIDYYGRDTGPLAEQLLVLPTGGYRLSFDLGGPLSASGTTLSWRVVCLNAASTTVLDLTLPPVQKSSRRVASAFTIPSGCPAQRLVIGGNAGEFPTPITATISSLKIDRIAARS